MSSYQTQLHHGARTGDESQLRSALLDSVTHDFRSPLTSIKAAVTALLADSRVGPSQRHEFLSVINEEAERLNRLVGNAIEISRLDAQVKLEPGAHTVAAIVGAAKEDCRSLLTSRLLSVQLASDLPMVRVDLQRVKQAMVQLLENAVKYSPSNEPISITASVSGKLVTIAWLIEAVASAIQNKNSFSKGSIAERTIAASIRRDFRTHTDGHSRSLRTAPRLRRSRLP